MRRLVGIAAVAAVALALPARAPAAPPPNDDFERAAPLAGPPAEVTGRTANATRQDGEPPLGLMTMSVWYAYTTSSARRVGVEGFRADGEDLYLAVFTGSGRADMQMIGSSSMNQSDPRLEFDAAPGTTYHVMLATEDPVAFTLRTTTTTPPANDLFSAARPVKVGVAYSGSFADATTELGEHDTPVRSVWFRYRAPRDERVTVDSGYSESANDVAVFTGGDVSRLHLVAWGDISPTGDSGSLVRFDAERGHVYSVALGHTTDTESGEYTLWVSDGGVKGKGVAVDVASGQTVASVRAHGLRATVRARRRVKIRLQLLVGGATAHRLGLHARVLGTARGSVDYGQQRPASVVLTSAARRALRGRTRLTATLRLVILDRRAPDRMLDTPVTL
jgi:hypothetical protein